MNKHSEQKVEFYSLPIKYLLNFRNIVLPIFFVINAIGFIGANLSVDLLLRVLFAVLAIAAFILFNQLDDFSFWSSIAAAALYAGWQIYNAVSSLLLMVGIGGSMESAMGGLTMGFVAGFGAIVGIITSVVLLGISSLFVIEIVELIKHKKLFFTSLKKLKIEFEE